MREHQRPSFSDEDWAFVPRDNLVNKYLLGVAQARKGIAVFTASEAGEQSMESERWGGEHGVFTHYLLEALASKADANGDGIVSLGGGHGLYE